MIYINNIVVVLVTSNTMTKLACDLVICSCLLLLLIDDGCVNMYRLNITIIDNTRLLFEHE